ncbi:MAG TPA: metallophosphoesterase [Candidatus Woesearchaeota archaeon]|nr:metallophosphoesterase [Candidatus Woesearchaeota archaeon]
MNILPGIRILGLTLYFEKQGVLVIADTHIGYEEALNKQGVLIPRLQFQEVMSNLERVFKKVKPKLIVMLGDIKHEFGTISKQEWRDTLGLLDYLVGKASVVLVKGNHDNILGPIARRKDLEVKDYFVVDDTLFCHGHKVFDDEIKGFKRIKTIIIGHEHPAISIRDGVRVEKYKCFLLGKYKDKNLVVMPSFNFVVEGTDVLQERLLSPFITSVSDFEVFVIGDKAYKFGRLSLLSRE